MITKSAFTGPGSTLPGPTLEWCVASPEGDLPARPEFLELRLEGCPEPVPYADCLQAVTDAVMAALAKA